MQTTPNPGNGQALLKWTKTKLIDKGHDAVLFDLTQNDIKHAGFKVVRAVSPSLIRPSFSHGVRHLGNQRVSQVPYRLGYVSEPLNLVELLSYEHPFP